VRHFDHGPDDARRRLRRPDHDQRDGEGAEEAVAALADLVEAKFGEE
jgi:hypothetical protein